MIRQPLGCILVLAVGVVALALSTGIVWAVNYLRPGLSPWGHGVLAVVLGLGFVLFYPLLDFLHRLEIRLFFRKRKLKVQRIRGFRNHYRVDYEAAGRKQSGKWPKDFEQWAA